MRTVRLAVMGAGGVGKSALTLRFTHGSYVADYDPTVEDQYTAHVSIDGQAVSLDILDTAGQEEYASLRHTFMDQVDGVMLVFSIVDDYTLDEMSNIHREVVDSNPDKAIPFLLVGNKVDLASDRAVTEKEAQHLARTFGDCQYLETSAKTNGRVKEAFESIVRSAIKSMDGGSGGGKSCGVFGIDASENLESSETKREGRQANGVADSPASLASPALTNTESSSTLPPPPAFADSASAARNPSSNDQARPGVSITGDISGSMPAINDGPSDLSALRAKAGLAPRKKRGIRCSLL